MPINDMEHLQDIAWGCVYLNKKTRTWEVMYADARGSTLLEQIFLNEEKATNYLFTYHNNTTVSIRLKG